MASSERLSKKTITSYFHEFCRWKVKEVLLAEAKTTLHYVSVPSDVFSCIP